MYEKRRFPRLDLKVDVSWTKIAGEKFGILNELSASKNISQGGICLMMDERDIELGNILHLEFSLNKLKKRIRANGRVVWVAKFETIAPSKEKRYQIGIEFLEIAKNDLKIIGEFVSESW